MSNTRQNLEPVTPRRSNRIKERGTRGINFGGLERDSKLPPWYKEASKTGWCGMYKVYKRR